MAKPVARSEHFGKYEPHYYGAAVQYRRPDCEMGKDKANTATGALNISLPLFAPAVYRAMSMTKTDIELAVEKSRASKQDLVNQVTKAYYQLMLSQDSYDVLQKAISWQKTIII